MSYHVKPQGRPCRLNKKSSGRILEALRRGLPYKLAAAYGGVSYDTLRRWRLKGEQEDAPPKFRKFCNAMKKAEGEASFNLVGKILDAAEDGDWKAASWILARRHPEEWGTKPNHPEDNDPKNWMGY